MVFSSITFLYYFLPVVLLLYLVMPRQWKNGILLVSSLFFYAWGGISFTILMVFMVGFTYVFGRLIERFRGRKGEQWIFWTAVGIHLLVLLYFKFVAEIFPIGISFYTFQLLSYLVDVYRGEVAAQRNGVVFFTYASMFPQLVAGPIVRYADVEKQLISRKHSLEQVADGCSRFIFGLAKKVLLANQLGELCARFRSSGDQSILFVWLYAVGFMLHIYFDFSGYSDMAVGLGKMFGFTFPENFHYPYCSKSITEFWRRWHISLGSWFRDYVYIPLGGSRVSKGRWIGNLLIVWSLTGIWHGGSWNFVVWGLLFGVLLVVEKLWLLRYLEKKVWFGHLYVLFWVLISFVIFDATDLGEAWRLLRRMFGIGADGFLSAESMYYLNSYLIIIGMAILGALPFPKKIAERGMCYLSQTMFGKKAVEVIETIVLAGLFLLVTAYLVDGSFNPFLYFRF